MEKVSVKAGGVYSIGSMDGHFQRLCMSVLEACVVELLL